MRGVSRVRICASREGDRGVAGERNFFFPYLCVSRRKRSTMLSKTPLFCVFFSVHETMSFCPKRVISFKRKGAKMCQFLNQSSICVLFFSFWSLVSNFFNQVPNWPSNFHIYTIKPLIWPDQLSKIVTWPQNFNFFQLKPKLT